MARTALTDSNGADRTGRQRRQINTFIVRLQSTATQDSVDKKRSPDQTA